MSAVFVIGSLLSMLGLLYKLGLGFIMTKLDLFKSLMDMMVDLYE
ncbi:hypothetical protein VII00023_18479 [Vibrio ichthyoenteri ATCC 700023]|uniref:Uncharacterized protein n=1 Tax=Vibrio ichthyoenteri ATCC 700023 TaxID=870968 RepID=F9S0K4_9VIBR|nr:hypothetical protein VII00023_18479 [Vibrio ichthyoenteri ATCC 700023]